MNLKRMRNFNGPPLGKLYYLDDTYSLYLFLDDPIF